MAISACETMDEYLKNNIDVEDNENETTSKNPLICSICHQYFKNPCLLTCYHSFCSHCIGGPYLDGKVLCPLCGQVTKLKEETQFPPNDHLLQQLVELVNSKNPQCANCDKRDKNSMFFCTTCGQALCTNCKEHTHRAKMFSTHELIHMSKCNQDLQKRCFNHGEQYIMFSQKSQNMVCAVCFRESSADIRLHYIDIDIAWQQAVVKIEKTYKSLHELQIKIHNGLIQLKSQLDNLRQGMEIEKASLNEYYQNLQDTLTKMQASIMTELYCDFDTKERVLRAQLLSLGSSLPIIDAHLDLCKIFMNVTSKYQFLELTQNMLERLSKVAQLGCFSKQPTLAVHLKSNYQEEFNKAIRVFIENQSKTFQNIQNDKTDLQQQKDTKPNQQIKVMPRSFTKESFDSDRFNKHCRIFDGKLQELNTQLKMLKKELKDLHQKIALFQKPSSSPLEMRYDHILEDCILIEQQLENEKLELQKLKAVFDALWEEQLCRIHLEKEVFHSQINDIFSLKSEVKQMYLLAKQLKPFMKTLPLKDNNSAKFHEFDRQNWQILLNHLAHLQRQELIKSKLPSFLKDQIQHLQSSTIDDSFTFSKGEECQYQKISEASTVNETKKQVQAQIHSEPSYRKTAIKHLRESASDSEDMFDDLEKSNQRKLIGKERCRRASYDSLSTTGSGSRRSSFCDAKDIKNSLILLIGSPTASSHLIPTQHSWETFPRPKSKRKVLNNVVTNNYDDPEKSLNNLKKADSFEGHEEAVRTLVAAVQETRSHTSVYQHRNNRKCKTN